MVSSIDWPMPMPMPTMGQQLGQLELELGLVALLAIHVGVEEEVQGVTKVIGLV